MFGKKENGGGKLHANLALPLAWHESRNARIPQQFVAQNGIR
jgi:hypothetical protein